MSAENLGGQERLTNMDAAIEMSYRAVDQFFSDPGFVSSEFDSLIKFNETDDDGLAGSNVLRNPYPSDSGGSSYVEFPHKGTGGEQAPALV